MRFFKIIFLVTIFLVQFLPVQAAELPYTLLFTKINFKNQDDDWLSFKVIASTQNQINLKGTIFRSDKVIKEISNNFYVQPGDEFTLIFKSTSTDNSLEKKLFTPSIGLTATTGIISLEQSGQILDFFCWTNGKANTKKQAAFEKIGTTNWNSKNLNDCFDSNSIKTNQTVVRKSNVDTNTKEDWMAENLLKTTTSKASTKKSSKAKSTKIMVTKNSSPPSSKRFIVPKNSSADSSSENATIKNILINEIFPNPKTDDTKNEWIELFNPGDEAVNLTGWQLDDGENGSKPYTFDPQSIIKPHDVLEIDSKESHLSLGNNEDSARLFNLQNELVDEVDYENAQEGMSFASIPFINSLTGEKSSQWKWIKDPSPGKINPVYTIFQGKVTKNVEFKEQYSFEFETDQHQVYPVNFTEQEVTGPIAKASFQSGNSIEITGVLENDGKIDLKYFQILSTLKTTDQNIWGNGLFVLMSGGIIGSLMYYFWKKSKIMLVKELNNSQN